MLHRDAITLKQLRAVRAVGREGSIAGAAFDLNLTSPAIHTQLKTLGEALGIEVTRRGTNGRIELTEAGEVLNRAGRRVDDILDGVIEDVSSLQAGEAGRIRLAVTPPAVSFAPKLIAALEAALPRVSVDLVPIQRRSAASTLRRGTVDIALVGLPPEPGATEGVPLGDHPHVLVSAPDHRLAKRRLILPAHLRGETFVVRERGTVARSLTEAYIDSLTGIGDPRRRQAESEDLIRYSVRAGLGIALVSIHMVAEDIDAGHLVVLDAPALPQVPQWHVLRPLKGPRSPAAERAYDLIQDIVPMILPRPALVSAGAGSAIAAARPD